MRDFRDVLSIVFFATLHAHGSWPKKKEFDIGEKIQPFFAALVKTPRWRFCRHDNTSDEVERSAGG